MNIKSSVLLLLFSTCFLFYHCQLELYLQGKRIYESQCSNCHMEDGSGLVEVIKDISQSPLFDSRTPDSLIRLLLKGGTETRADGLLMPSYKDRLNRVELCNLINYLNSKWDTDFVEIDIIRFDSIYNRVTAELLLPN